MTFEQRFIDLPLSGLHREASVMKAEGWRFIQTHAVFADEGVDLYYSFMKSGEVRNYRVAGVQKGMEVPSITDLFLAAFVFENEARELFGVDMRDIAID
ncbi:MAG TPA: NADH:ubiquinone oxidoreductase, partial [Eggerthellaceae bacterium]|nr:NADH:ubiquinone oxidoreductase [Eggerthellaceae bacterium]